MSLTFRTNEDLTHFNTFGIRAMAATFVTVSSIDDLRELLGMAKVWPVAGWTILGGGSNVLFTHDLSGLVVLNRIQGIRILEESDSEVRIQFGAGEIWHHCVMWAIRRQLGGVENLALIPGTIGAAPMQNIGAYGTELRQVFHSLEAMDLHTGEICTFGPEECRFGYRESVFKHEGKGRYFIVSVTLRLTPAVKHPLNLEYGAIRDELAASGAGPYGIQDVAEAVMRIRRSKLPDPEVTGNAGSFFKNPEIPVAQYQELMVLHPGMPGYPAAPGMMKLAAGWLIEKAGWKGFRNGDAGVHDRQALVLVNHGHATGSEILALSEKIILDVQQKFGVTLHREVNVI